VPEAVLGYRGLVVEQVGRPAAGLPERFRVADGDLVGASLARRAADTGVERYLLGPGGPVRAAIGDALADLALGGIEPLRTAREAWPGRAPGEPKAPLTCPCAPLYEPSWWNQPTIQPYNNCYNYSTNTRTDTFAQPGQAAGQMYTGFTCPKMRPAAVADALVDRPGANNRCPKEGHLVALVIWPGNDFHWYRKGRQGLWSHKPGSTPATKVDNSGALISDPRTADRGPYTAFCTFMVVMHGHVKIG
jgi:hypothetical protein